MIAAGFNHGEVSAAIAAVGAAGALPYVMAPRRSPIKANGGDSSQAIIPVHHLEAFQLHDCRHGTHPGGRACGDPS